MTIRVKQASARIRETLNSLVYPSSVRRTYRSFRNWVHISLITITGFANLFYAGVVELIADAQKQLNREGFGAFFDGVQWHTVLTLALTGIPHLVFAVVSLVVVSASLDALKERLLDSGPDGPI